MGQYGFDRACFSVVFLFLLYFIAHLYEANGGTDMEVLACFRPGFFVFGSAWYNIFFPLFCRGGGGDFRPVIHYRDLDAPREHDEFI